MNAMHFVRSLVDCPPGHHAVLGKDHTASCKSCPLGYYQTERGKMTCIQCPKGYTTSQKGSYEHAQCKGNCNGWVSISGSSNKRKFSVIMSF